MPPQSQPQIHHQESILKKKKKRPLLKMYQIPPLPSRRYQLMFQPHCIAFPQTLHHARELAYQTPLQLVVRLQSASKIPLVFRSPLPNSSECMRMVKCTRRVAVTVVGLERHIQAHPLPQRQLRRLPSPWDRSPAVNIAITSAAVRFDPSLRSLETEYE